MTTEVRDYAGDHDEKLKVVEAMENYGGSFVKALGIALRFADVFNTKKIKDAFPEYWAEYKEMAERKKK